MRVRGVGSWASAWSARSQGEATGSMALTRAAMSWSWERKVSRAPEMAGFAGREAEIVAANITALTDGGEPTAYQPMGTGIAIPIGPHGGAGQCPGQDEILGADIISDVKGRDMMVDRFQELFGLAVAAID